MARIVLISPYLKGGQNAAKLAHRTRYVATRLGVELLADERSTLPATKKATRCRCTCEQVWKRIFCAAIVKETFWKNSSFVCRVVVCVVVTKRRCRNVRLHESPAKAFRPSGTQ